MVKCGKCGNQNPPGHLFCLQCRAKLDLKTHADSEMLRLPGTPGTGTKRVLLAAALAIAGVAGLMFWPVDAGPGIVTPDDYSQACRKIRILDSLPGSGAQVLSENELNAYMRTVTARAKTTAPAGPLTPKIDSVDLVLKPGVMMLKVERFFGPVKLGRARSTFELTGIPVPGKDGFRFKVKSGKFGHLPVPRLFCAPFLSDLEIFFSKLEKERAFLDRIDMIRIADGSAAVSMRR